MVAQNKKLNTGRIFNTNTHTRNIKKLKNAVRSIMDLV
jgi:hypothetical protein